MNSKLFIPEKIKVGFQERSDTFTKRLAYVIYYDEKGVLRKEKSWQSWRSDKIDPIDVENKPYSGFTLNKGILRDGYWGGGHNMVRIYDDRGIEFEITISNLMYILMGNDCNKRVLSGEFVYAWNGTELVLLPTNTEEFKISTTFTSLKTNKVTMKEVQANVGCMFKTKDLQDWVYLGKLEQNNKEWVYEKDRNGRRDYGSGKWVSTRQKNHIYYNLKTEKYFSEKSSNKLAYLVEPNKVHNFEELLEGYFASKHYMQISEVVIEIEDDITDCFTTEKRHTPFTEGAQTFFIDNKGYYYSGNYPSSVERVNRFIDFSNYYNRKSLYWQSLPSPPKDTDSVWSRTSYQNATNPSTNDGYTEWNVLNNGLRFNRIKVTLKDVEGKLVESFGRYDLESFSFTENPKITIIN